MFELCVSTYMWIVFNKYILQFYMNPAAMKPRMQRADCKFNQGVSAVGVPTTPCHVVKGDSDQSPYVHWFLLIPTVPSLISVIAAALHLSIPASLHPSSKSYLIWFLISDCCVHCAPATQASLLISPRHTQLTPSYGLACWPPLGYFSLWSHMANSFTTCLC